MTGPQRTAGVLICLLAAGLTGCTSQPDPEPTPPVHTSSPNTAASTSSVGEAQVRLALGDGSTDDDPAFVAMGFERLAEGAHTQTVLDRGKGYALQVVCVGTTSVKITGTGLKPSSAACDGTIVSQRITNAPADFTLNVRATGGGNPSGSIGWRLNRLSN